MRSDLPGRKPATRAPLAVAPRPLVGGYQHTRPGSRWPQTGSVTALDGRPTCCNTDVTQPSRKQVNTLVYVDARWLNLHRALGVACSTLGCFQHPAHCEPGAG